MGYKIGSFNLRNIGYNALDNNKDETKDRNISMIAQIIKKEQFDVVALQEVLSEGKAFTAEGVKNNIIMELGGESRWGFAWADVSNTTDSRNEGYAFIWNKDRLKPAEVKLPNGQTRVFHPRRCEIKSSELARMPYYGRFTPVNCLGGSYFELRLICVHTWYGDDNKKDRERRKKEIDIILKEIYPQISDRAYYNSMPSYTIVLGDYNVELLRPWKEKLERNKPAYLEADSEDIVEASSWGGKRIKTVQDAFTTLRSKYDDDVIRKDGRKSHGYAHDYDHFSYDVDRFEDVDLKVRMIDAVRENFGNDPEAFIKYRGTVSDHVPIVMSIELNQGGDVRYDNRKDYYRGAEKGSLRS